MPGQVLVYATLPQDGAMAERVLRSAGIATQGCATPIALGQALERGIGALLIVEEALQGPVLATVARHVAAQPAWSDLPIVMMAKRGADSLEAQRAVEKLGNVTVLERPVRTMSLVSAARSALRGRSRQYEVRALGERKDQFLATLAHELRNPLAPIRNAAEVLQRLHPSPKVESLVGIVHRQVNHLTRLVDDLLDVARITNGKLQLQPSTTSAARVVLHALEIADAPINAKGHRVRVQQPQHEVTLRADHVRLVQIVANLLVNAAKFTPPSGDITLKVDAQGDTVEFVVTDSGRGIAPEDAARIFDMFEQARAAGEPSAGLGLGLHLAKALAELHGGSATVHSDGLGRGSRFTLRLPVVVDRPSEPAPGAGAVQGPLPQSVLLVDDNVDAANTLQTLLSLYGLAVTVVHDGEAAVAHVCEHAPDVVVMDIGMPRMDGYEAARQIRSRLPGAKPLLVALTGWGQYADKTRAADAGFDYHFVKPLALPDLLECMGAAMAEEGSAG